MVKKHSALVFRKKELLLQLNQICNFSNILKIDEDYH